MLKLRAVPLLMSIAVLAVVISADSSNSRNKRQAPNHNVHDIPKTSFTCDDKNVGEYYADTEAHCQVYHVCIPGMNNRLSLISFVCPNGTIFSQATKVCTPYERIECRLTSQFTSYGNGNNRRTNYEADEDYENYVPSPPPRPQPQPARQNAPSRSRNTPAPPPPPPTPVTQPPRPNRFRSGSNQFRGQQATTSTTAAPAPARVPVRGIAPAQPPPLPVRGAIAVPGVPARPAFRPPILAARPPQASAAVANAIPARPTPRTVVSTSTSSYNYEYEYEYDYEDEQPAGETANARSKRETQKENASSFTCDDKVPGAAYADLESNCQMFHICILLGKDKVLDYKVHCADGTSFDQQSGSCREQEEVVCENSEPFYQFDKPDKSTNKKATISKKKYLTSKKPSRLSKE